MTNTIEEIISKRDFQKFIALKEDLFFEAKCKAPYNLNIANDRYEFLKDITAFANAEGGYLIIGLKISPSKDELTDIIKDLDLFEKKYFEPQSYLGIIKTHVYPRIKDLKCGWVESKNKKRFGIAYFLIPKQSKDEKLFLINKVVEDNKIIKEIIVGIAIRNGSQNIPLTVDQLHNKIRNGLSPLAQRLTRIENLLVKMNKGLFFNLEKQEATKLQPRLQPPTVPPPPILSYISYIKTKINSENGIFYLESLPKDPQEDMDYFFDRQSKIFTVVADPPDLRKMGWGLSTAYTEQPYPNVDRWESANGDRKIVIVSKKGVVCTAGSIKGFLDWGISDYTSSEIADFNGILVNNFALVEYVDNYARFLKDINDAFESKYDYVLTYGFYLPSGIKLGLFRPMHLGIYFQEIVGPIKTTEDKITITRKDLQLDGAHLAGKIMQELYAVCFGETELPLAYLGKDEKGRPFVEEDRFLKNT